MKTVSSTSLHSGTRELLNKVEDGEHYKVMRYKETAAYLVPVSWYEAAAAALMTQHNRGAGTDVTG